MQKKVLLRRGCKILENKNTFITTLSFCYRNPNDVTYEVWWASLTLSSGCIHSRSSHCVLYSGKTISHSPSQSSGQFFPMIISVLPPPPLLSSISFTAFYHPGSANVIEVATNIICRYIAPTLQGYLICWCGYQKKAKIAIYALGRVVEGNAANILLKKCSFPD